MPAVNALNGSDRRWVRLASILALVMWTIISPGAPMAQESGQEGNISVLARPHPELDPLGVRTGAFDWFPSIALGTTYNDNILATQFHPLADAIFTLSPAVSVQSNWAENEIDLSANSIFSRYQTYPAQDSNQWIVSANGKLEAYHDLILTARAGYAYLVFARTADAYTQITLKPLLYGNATGQVQAVKVFNRLQITAVGTVAHFDYSDGLSPTGQVIDETFRNRTAWQGEIRGDYEITPSLSLFLEEKITQNNYTNAMNRNSFVTDTLFGTKIDLTHFVSGEIGAGYYTANFADPDYEDVKTLGLNASLIYFPTQLINVTLAANRGLIDSGLPGDPVYMNNNIVLRTDYELLRSLILSAILSGTYNEYHVLDRRDTDLGLGLIATYRMNRSLTMNLNFQRLSQTSVGAQRGPIYVDNTVFLSFTLQR